MKCLICQQEVALFNNLKNTITFGYCHACTFIFKPPQTHQAFQEQKKRYDLHQNDPTDEGYKAYFQRFLDFTLPHLHSIENALDFGCGKSTLLATMLEKRHISCDVYDPIYHPNETYKTKTYDLIVSTEVFEHLHHPKEVFKALIIRLKKGGFLALQTEFHPNTIEAFQKWYYHLDPTHVVFFTPYTFEVLAQRYGCKVVATDGKNKVLLQKDFS
jgi:SAM-dependent methyltransferase